MAVATQKSSLTLKGSFTVEASIVFSVVFLLVTVLVYVFIIMYQHAFLQSVANQAANEGAYFYVNQYNNDFTLKTDFNLYWRIADSHSSDKEIKINSYIGKRLESSILNSDRYIDNEVSNKFLLKQLKINIEERYPLPIENLFMIFGISPTLNLKAEVIAPLDDNAEFIRNLDTFIDIKNCLMNSDNKWIGKDSKASDIIDKLLRNN